MGWLDRVSRTRAELQPTRVFRPTARGGDDPEQRFGLSQLMEMFSYQGVGYSVYGGDHQNVERDTTSFIQYVNGYYRDNGVVFAVVLARLLLFTEARFQWQRIINGRPGDLFGTAALDLLEHPWPNGTTGDLLARMEQDVSLHGNFYAVREPGRIRRLRPDWVEIVLDVAPAEAVASNIKGYLYRPGGAESRVEPELFLPHEMAHWAPIPDPLAQYRGMSWVTPVIREVTSDRAASDHKQKFFENAATPNLAVSFSENITQQQFQAFMSAMNSAHQGGKNAYKTMYLGGGADVKVIGSNMEQMDFKSTQGAGETRICAAGGVPPIIVGLSEGLSSATYSNYGMARRKFGDHWARPQWRSACAALSNLIDIPRNARLWYDDRDIAFLREDQKDVAAIQTQQASTMKQLIDAGYEPESVTSALMNEDWSLLKHTGLFSVQLQPPGTKQPPGGGPPEPLPPAGEDGPTPPTTPEKPRAPSGEPEEPSGGSQAGSGGASASETKGEPERGHVEALVGVITRLQDQVDRLQDRLDAADTRHFVGAGHPRDPKGQWTEKGPGGLESPDPAPTEPTTGSQSDEPDDDAPATPEHLDAVRRALDRFEQSDGELESGPDADPEQALAELNELIDMMDEDSEDDGPAFEDDKGVQFTGGALTEPGAEYVIARSDGAGVAGALAMRRIEDEGTGDTFYYVEIMGSTGVAAGTGSALAKRAAEIAARDGLALMGQPAGEDAAAFWRKIGWDDDPLDNGGDLLGWTPEQTREVADL